MLKLSAKIIRNNAPVWTSFFVNITFDEIGGRADTTDVHTVDGLTIGVSKWNPDQKAYMDPKEFNLQVNKLHSDIPTPSLQPGGYDRLKIEIYSKNDNLKVEGDHTEIECVRHYKDHDHKFIYPYVPSKHTNIVPPYSKDVIEKNKYQSPLMFYKDKDNICLRHGLSVLSTPDISYEICNRYGDPMVNGTIVSTNTKSNPNTLEIPSQDLVPLMHMEDGTDANRLIIKANGVPIFDDTLDKMQTSLGPDCDKVSGIKATLANSNFNLNLTTSPPSYSQIGLNPLEPGILKVLEKFEVKVKGQSLNKEPHPIGKPQTDGKIIINCFDYNSDEKTHPKPEEDIEIIAHTICGKSFTIYTGKLPAVSDQYKVSEWHAFKEGYDALYLNPVSPSVTDIATKYDITIGTVTLKSVDLDRQENKKEKATQRLRLDFTKYTATLPKLGEQVSLKVYTILNPDKPLSIDLGKVEKPDELTSVNALEKAHEITAWGKDADHYTSITFNKGSNEITGYLIKVNTNYYGEFLIKEPIKELNLSNINKEISIKKGDIVEIYGYKKDGEAVLLQNRYAGTLGVLGTYSSSDAIQSAYLVTKWEKDTDHYTSITFGNLKDPISSYMKTYDVRVNGVIVRFKQQDDMKFTFAEGYPKHGDKIQIVAHTYTGEVVEIPEQLAGTIGDVTEKEITSTLDITKWNQNGDKRYTTIIFDASKLKDEIQAHIQSYTIEYKGYDYSGDWIRFGENIQMYANGTLHLEDCKASKLLGAHVALRITANFYESKLKPLVVIDSATGLLTQVPEADILSLYKNATWDVVNPGEFYTTLRLEKDKIAYQDYIQYYDIVVDGKPYTNLINPFKLDGTLSIEEFGIKDDLRPKHATRPITTTNHMSRVTVDAHLFGGTVYKNVSISYPGTKGSVPTKDDIQKAHTNPKWNLTGNMLSSVTFPNLKGDIITYLSDYQVFRWSQPEPNTTISFVSDDTIGVTITFKPSLNIMNNKGTKDQFTIKVNFVNLEEPVVVIQEKEPISSVSPKDIQDACTIDQWIIYNENSGQVNGFYLNKNIEKYFDQIKSFNLKVDEKDYKSPWKSPLTDKDTVGFAFRLDPPVAKDAKLDLSATLADDTVLELITIKAGNGKTPEEIKKAQQELKKQAEKQAVLDAHNKKGFFWIYDDQTTNDDNFDDKQIIGFCLIGISDKVLRQLDYYKFTSGGSYTTKSYQGKIKESKKLETIGQQQGYKFLWSDCNPDGKFNSNALIEEVPHAVTIELHCTNGNVYSGKANSASPGIRF
ncbi:hypothetical protein ACLBXI_28245 [Bacillus cereus]